MTFSNNPQLRRYLIEGGLAHLAVYATFEFEADRFEERLNQVGTQHPYLDPEEAAARAAYRMLAAQAKRHRKAAKITKRLGIRFWIVVAAILIGGLLAGYFCSAHAEPTPEQEQRFLRAVGNAMRGVSLLAASPAAPQQPSGLIVQFRNGGSTLATRPAGLVVLDCGTNMSCSFSGSTFTLTSSATGSTAWSAITAGTNTGQALLVGNGSSFAPTGSGTITSTAFTPAGTLDNCVKWGASGTLADFGAACGGGGGGGAPAFTSITTGTNTTATMTVGSGATLTFSGSGNLNARKINGTEFSNAESLGKIPIGQGDGTAVWADPLVQGLTSHDAAGSSTNPVAIGGYASAAAPTDVSADNDITRAWLLRNGSQVVNLASGGTLVTLGQKAMSASLPVVIASDQSAVPASQSGTWNINNISGAVSLPTGASTSANQTTQITSLQLIDNLPHANDSALSNGVPIQGQLDDTSTGTVAENNVSAVRITSGRALHVAQQGNLTIGTFPDNEPINVAQMNGVTVTMGNGASGTGVQRVTIANDSTGQIKLTDGTDTAAVTAGGELSVNCGNCTGAGASATDDTAFTATSDDVAPMGALYDTTPPSITDGNIGAPRMTSARVLMVDGSATTQPVSGTVTIGTFPDNEPINVAQMNGVAVTMNNGASGTGVQRVTLANDSTGNIATIGTSVTPGTAAANLGKAEDAAHSSADVGVMALGVRDDYPPTATAGATAEYQPFLTDEAGAQYVRAGGSGTGSTAPWTGYLNCDNTAVYDASTNGSTQLVALTSNQTVYVCGYQISSSSTSAVTVNLRYGTGTNCATSPSNITPAYPIQAATSTGPIGLVVMTPGFTGLKTAVSNALCINTNAAVSVQAIVWYAKF